MCYPNAVYLQQPEIVKKREKKMKIETRLFDILLKEKIALLSIFLTAKIKYITMNRPTDEFEWPHSNSYVDLFILKIFTFLWLNQQKNFIIFHNLSQPYKYLSESTFL